MKRLGVPAYFSLISLVLLLGQPALAWAVQKHGGAEGLISHELGHLLFITGMLFLLYRMNQRQTRPLTRGRGWFAFRLFLWLIILWNILTFYGHWHAAVISPAKFVQGDGAPSAFHLTRPLDLLFYFSRLDHLVLLPAFLCLLLALYKWRQQE